MRVTVILLNMPSLVFQFATSIR